MFNPFLIITLLFAILEWIAVARAWKKVEYFAKPATMLAMLVWFWFSAGFAGTLRWFALSIFLSLLGDALLLHPRLFIPGLVAFLVAHSAYILGFNSPPPVINSYLIFMTAAIGVLAWRLYRRLALSLKTQPTATRWGVAIYSLVITLMLLSAFLTLLRTDWLPSASLLVSLGALLFLTSDVLLAWVWFVAPIRHGRIIVMVTYHLGQLLLVAGAMLQYG